MAIKYEKKGNITCLTAAGIPVPHGFTTRLGGVSEGIFSSLNIGIHRGDDPENVRENYRILGDALGFDTHKLVLTHQVHGDTIRRAGKADWGRDLWETVPDCDGLITDEPGTALVIFTADCTPVLLYDPDTGAVGAVHAGWRGTAADIAGKAVKAMADSFGSDPSRIRAAIGPNIGFCCFETGAEVPEAMEKTYGEGARPYIRPAGNKFHVDLKGLNALSLERAGVRSIEISTDCTVCSCDTFWSHRVTKGERGSQGAVIVCKEGKK